MIYSKVKFKNHGLKVGEVYVFDDGEFRQPKEEDASWDFCIVSSVIDENNFNCWTGNESLLKLDREYTEKRINRQLNDLKRDHKRYENEISTLEKELREFNEEKIDYSLIWKDKELMDALKVVISKANTSIFHIKHADNSSKSYNNFIESEIKGLVTFAYNLGIGSAINAAEKL